VQCRADGRERKTLCDADWGRFDLRFSRRPDLWKQAQLQQIILPRFPFLSIVRNMIGAIFSTKLYCAIYVIIFFLALVVGYPGSIVGFYILVFCLGTLWSPAILLAIVIVVLPIYRSFRSFRRRLWSAAIGHLFAPLVAAGACLMGFLAAPFLAVADVSLQLSWTFALYRPGVEPPDKNIEIISTSPKIAAYAMGYLEWFQFPGSEGTYVYFVLDETGRFAELASQCRVRELAGTPELASREYMTYRSRGVVTHLIGSFYEARYFDVGPCS
jgi:hypothetical protein